jgi:hypothetical protein
MIWDAPIRTPGDTLSTSLNIYAIIREALAAEVLSYDPAPDQSARDNEHFDGIHPEEVHAGA